jgi:hypothetical protein
VEHRKGLPWLRLRRRGVTGDQTQALGPGVETVAFEHTPDAVAGDSEAAPLGPAELQAQTVGPPARVGEGQGQDALPHHGRDRVRHPRPATLAGAQDLGAEADQLPLPAVGGRVVDAEHPAGGSDAAHLLGQCEQARAAAIEDIIIGHGGVSSAGLLATHRMASPLPFRTTSRCRVYSGRGHPKLRREHWQRGGGPDCRAGRSVSRPRSPAARRA